jgi:hypothetical protein
LGSIGCSVVPVGASDDQGGRPRRLSLKYEGGSYLEEAADGWWAWYLGGQPTGARVRFTVLPSLRVAVSDLLLSDPDQGVSAAILRQIPIGRMEKAAAPLVRFTGSDVTVKVETVRARATVGPIRVRVTAKGHKKPDEFYEAVARDYSGLAQSSSRPATELAKINGVPQSTAHRWIREARRRGLMPKGKER